MSGRPTCAYGFVRACMSSLTPFLQPGRVQDKRKIAFATLLFPNVLHSANTIVHQSALSALFHETT